MEGMARDRLNCNTSSYKTSLYEADTLLSALYFINVPDYVTLSDKLYIQFI